MHQQRMLLMTKIFPKATVQRVQFRDIIKKDLTGEKKHAFNKSCLKSDFASLDNLGISINRSLRR